MNHFRLLAPTSDGFPRRARLARLVIAGVLLAMIPGCANRLFFYPDHQVHAAPDDLGLRASDVEFRSEEVRNLDAATLLFAGKSFEKSESLGEVSLSAGRTVKSLAKTKPHKSRRKAQEPAVATDTDLEPGATELDEEETETVESSEAEEATATEEAAEEAEGEDWVIGEN